MAVLKDMHLTIEKDPNTTALALVGHSLIRVRWQVKASNACNTGYPTSGPWLHWVLILVTQMMCQSKRSLQ